MKRTIKGILFFIFTMLVTISFVFVVSAVSVGDIDKNGSVTASDARFILRASVGLEKLSEEQKILADADFDGNVTAADARLVLRTSVGLEKIEDPGETHTHEFETAVTKTPTCTKEGEQVTACKSCSYKKVEILGANGHIKGEWTVILDSTVDEEGIERSKCENCGYYTDRAVEKKTAVYFITVDSGADNVSKKGVAADGKYTLSEPHREGYIFKGWVDSEGKEFASSGTIKADASVCAVWELDGTDTLKKLVTRANAGTDVIVITDNITVNQPIYVPYETVIYSDGDFSITRAPDYAGDIFVVGTDKNGSKSVMRNRKAILTLGGGEGMLTIDGNKDNVTKPVNGTAVFVADSSELNIYDGVRIVNNLKTENERVNKYSSIISSDAIVRVGGAAVINIASAVNMYGGIIENNGVATEYTVNNNEDGTTTLTENNGCGGGIYNRGTFNMYGGVISSNEALRGGGVYNDKYCYLISGEISGNTAHTYGGAVSSSSTSNADMFIGSDNGAKTMLFKGNHSLRAGGALYSNTSSPIVIYGNAEFTENRSDSSGGAIYTAGPLTASGTDFNNNTCEYSGGAIYHHYTKAEFNRRFLSLNDCVFDSNSSGLGGAVILSASGSVTDEGTYGTVEKCTFIRNQAVVTSVNPGNGGALYITRNSDAVIKNCSFEENTAVTNAGALAIHSGANVTLSDTLFINNNAALGGAVYSSSNSIVNMTSIEFNGNSAHMKENGSGGNGGALYYAGSTVTVNNVDFYNNTAENNAGAVYQNASTINLDETCDFVGNSAGNHGGAIYLTYTNNEDGTKTGSELIAENVIFKENSALAGGAISGRTSTKITLDKVSFLANSTPDATVSTVTGGGAVYSNNSEIKITDSVFDGNSSGYYGGALRFDSCNTEIKNTQILNSSGGTGGAVYASGEALTANNLTLKGNTSALNGVMYITCKEASFTDMTATENTAVNGGVLYAGRKAQINVNNSLLSLNNAREGGTFYITAEATVDADNCRFIENNATKGQGGAVYVLGAFLKVRNNSVFTKNTASGNGGAISSCDKLDETTGEKTYSGVTVTECAFDENIGACGGAVYFNDTSYSLDFCSFLKNTATTESYGGGAVYNTGATGSINNVTFTENSALRGGAVAIYTNSSVDFSNITAQNNEATAEGGVIYANKCKVDLTKENIVLTGNKANNGGAVYAISSPLFDVSGARIEQNYAAKNGGALYAAGSTLNISGKDTVISKNEAAEHGGAIYVSYITDADAQKIGGVLNITDTDITENKALSGGAVSGRTNSVINLTNLSLSNNSTPDATMENKAGGGAIYTNNSEVILSNVNVSGNLSGYYGGALFTEATKVTIKDGTVIDSNSGGTGGALYLTSNSSLNAESITVTNNNASANGVIYLNGKDFVLSNISASGNTADWNGGVIFFSGAKTKGTIMNSAFRDNESATGGAIFIKGSGVSISDSLFEANTASSNGGAIAMSGGDMTAAGENVFKSNSSQSFGGAVYVSYSTDSENVKTPATFTMRDGIFEENTALAGGAVASRTACTVSLSKTNIVGNTATGEKKDEGGGAVFTNNNTLTLSGVIIDSNSSAYYGGAVSALSATVTVNDNSQIKNNKGVTGAAFNFRDAGTYTLSDISITDNSGEKGSGTVYITGSGTLDITGLNATGNKNNNGGVIYSSGAAVINVSESVFEDNTAESGGGSIYHRSSGQLSVSNSSFIKNDANNGGAVYLYGTTARFTDNNEFSENNASVGGGAIDVVGAKTVIAGACDFTDNNASNHGGAIYVTYIPATEEEGSQPVPGNLSMTNGSFTGNTALGGGAVSIRSRCEAVFDGTLFTDNKVVGYDMKADNTGLADGDGESGGAIYVGFGKLTLTDVVAENNIAEAAVSEENGEIIKNFGGAVDAVGATVNVTGGIYKNNKASTGGAFNAITNTKLDISGAVIEANESTYAKLDYDNTVGGGAVNIIGGSLTMNAVILDGNKTGYYGGAIMASGTKVNILGGSTVKNSEGATGAALHFKNKSDVTIADTEVINNKSSNNGVIYANNSTLTATSLIATGNTAKNGGVFYTSNAKTKITVTESTIMNNSATSHGGVSYTDNATVSFTDCKIESNTAKDGGVVYSVSGNANFTGGEVVRNTAAADGGVVYSVGGNVNFTDGEVAENSSAVGGVVYSESNSNVSFDGACAIKNVASKSGGVIYGSESIYTMISTEFLQNSAPSNGGAVYISSSELNVEDSEFNSNSSGNNGGAVYVLLSAVQYSNSRFYGNTAKNNGGAMDIVGSNVTATENCDFSENSSLNHGGAVYVVYVEVEDESGTNRVYSKVNMAGGSFIGNSSMGGGAVSIRSGCEAVFDGTSFTNNSVSGFNNEADGDGEGGGAVYVGFGKLTLNNVTASGNTANDTVNTDDDTGKNNFGGAVDAVGATVNVTGGAFENNKAAVGGAFNAISNTKLEITEAVIKENESMCGNLDSDNTIGGGAVNIVGGSLTVERVTFDGNKTGYYGGAVMAAGTRVNILGGSTVKNSEGATGAALYFRDACNITLTDISVENNNASANGVVYVNGGIFNAENVTASGNVGANGGVLYISGASTKAYITECSWSENTANFGGTIYQSSAKIEINGSEFSKNSSYLGGVVYNSRGALTINNAAFSENTAEKSSDGNNGNGGAVTLSGGSLTATGSNIFTKNTAENHGGAVYVSYAKNDDETKVPGTLTMTDGVFDGNSAFAGGAISSRTSCVVSLTATELKNNSASGKDGNGGGGAVYTNDNTITLSGVTVTGNSSGYYGGALTAQNATVTVKDNSAISNNIGITGVTFNIRGTSDVTLTDISVTDNIATAGSGVIYATGSASLDISGLTATGNKNNNGGVLYISGSVSGTIKDSELSGNTAVSFGGALDHRSSGTLTVTDTTISGNTAKNGGAVNTSGKSNTVLSGCIIESNTASQKGGAIYHASSGTVTIKNSTLSENTAAESGGAIYASGTGLVNVYENTSFNKNSAPTAGAMHLDLGAVASVSSVAFDGNTATGGDGGAVLVSDSGKEGTAATSLTLTDSVFKNNTASSKGGAISTDTSSPELIINAVSCTFNANKALGAGGGAVEIQNGNCNSVSAPDELKLVFKNCIFTENTAKTTGGAIEIRTNSCAEFDGITATKNEAVQSGGVFYVTSVHSRLYLTGTVENSSNTAKSGSFAYLYNNKYTNPPKIYTTHSSSAAWCDDVGGNSSNIDFDVTNMP